MKIKSQADEKTKIGIVKLYRNGTSVEELVASFGYSKKTIYNWINCFNSTKKIKRANLGNVGRPSKIDDTNVDKILKIIKMPASEFGFENDLWNTSRVKTICKKKLKIEISRMSIWRLLDKNEQSFKKVQKQYYEACELTQSKWVKSTLPKIKKVLKTKNAILYFEDESCIQLSPVMGKSWGPRSEKIIHKVTGNKGSISAISAISNDGRLFFEVFDKGKRFNAEDIINFLQKLLSNHARRHLVVVMDQAPCHTAKKVKTFCEGHKRIDIFYLPPRSPRFNPDEKVWAVLKSGLKSHQETNIAGLKKITNKKLTNLAKNSKKVKAVFKLCDMHHLYMKKKCK